MEALRDFKRIRRNSGFTLIELLAATMVLGVILVLLGQILSHVGQTWVSGRGGAHYRRNAQALADFIGVELAQAVAPIGEHNVADGSNLQFLVNPPGISNKYLNADALFWQAPIATETTFGDIAIIGYFVEWRNGTPYLCRLFINPSSTDITGNLIENPDYQIYSSATSSGWLTDDLLSRLVRPDDAAAGYRGLLAPNVIGFWVRCFGPDGAELSKVYDSHVGYKFQVSPPLANGGVVEMTRRLPAVVEVSMVMADSGYAARLPNAEAALKALVAQSGVVDAQAFYQAFLNAADGNATLGAIRPGVRIYSKKIHIAGRR